MWSKIGQEEVGIGSSTLKLDRKQWVSETIKLDGKGISNTGAEWSGRQWESVMLQQDRKGGNWGLVMLELNEEAGSMKLQNCDQN